jgi:hypothetical protein
MNRLANGRSRSKELFEDSILSMVLVGAVLAALASGVASLGGL